MNILIDIFLLLLVVLTAAAVARKNKARAVIRLIAVTAAAAAGIFLAPYLAPEAAPLLAQPVQNSAAAALAKLANTPVMGNAEETLGKIDLVQLEQRQPEPFAAAVRSYGADPKALLQAAEEENAPAKEAMLLGEAMSLALAKACCCAVLTALVLLLLLPTLDALFRRQSKSKKKQKGTAASVVLGILTGLIAAAFIAVPFIEIFRPFSAGILGTVNLDAACGKSVIYRLLQQCNPLI